MSKYIHFSVIIPLFNKEKEITRALASVFNQTYPHYEIIVVNDGSTDKSVRAIEHVHSKIKLINQKNSGASAARNTGIMNAAHDYIAFLDADDEWDKQFLSNIVELIQRFPDAGIFCTNYYKSLNSKKCVAIKDTSPELLVEIDYFKSFFKGSTPVSSSSACIPKSILIEEGLFPTNITLYEDLYFWIKVSLDYKIAFHTSTSATYHRDATNRACKRIIPDETYLPFKNLIEQAIASGKLNSESTYYALKFCNHYALLNAFKALTNGQTNSSRKCLAQVKGNNFRQQIRKLFILVLGYLPYPIIQAIWITGKKLK